MNKHPVRSIDAVQKPAEEWMVADAWYRPLSGTATGEMQQEGPYQYGWSGNALPNFAPHFARRQYEYPGDDSARITDSATIRKGRADGKTNTVFFDGHSESVRSRALTKPNGKWAGIYGFPGTVNPLKENPPDTHPIWTWYWE